MATVTFRDLFAELGAIYDRAVHELDARDLRAFILHEAQWLQHVPDDSQPLQLYELRVRQADSYLRSTLALYKKKSPGRRRRVQVIPLRTEHDDQ